MPTDDEILDLESSTGSAPDETTAAPDTSTEGTQSEDAGSSPATGETEGALSAVRDVLSESRKQAASPAEDGEEGQSAASPTPKTQDDENYSDVPFSKHPRFQQLIRQRNSFRQDAERYQNVTTFLENSGLSADEAADGLIIMSLMKTNPVEAWKRLKPAVQRLLVASGEILPDDLQRMVQAGQMSREAAMEVSRSRAGVASMQVQQSFREQLSRRQAVRSASTALAGAATDWESERRRKDPNFESKLVPLQKEILFLQRTEGRPNTAEGVKAQLDRAYKAVSAAARPAPKPQPKAPVKPIRGGQVAGNQRPAEQTTLDIVRANRRGAA